MSAYGSARVTTTGHTLPTRASYFHDVDTEQPHDRSGKSWPAVWMACRAVASVVAWCPAILMLKRFIGHRSGDRRAPDCPVAVP